MKRWVVKLVLAPSPAGWRDDVERVMEVIHSGSVMPDDGGENIAIYTQTKARTPSAAITAICNIIQDALDPDNVLCVEARLAR